MEFENQKERKIVIIGLILFFVLVVFGVIMFLNRDTEIKQLNEPKNSGSEEEVYDFINVIYTDNGFVPPAVISSETRINFKNRTSEDVQMMLMGNDVDFDETIEVSSLGETMQEFSPGEYTATVAGSERQINIRIKN